MGLVVLFAAIPLARGDEAPARTPLDRELDQVWGKERDIKVIEKRLYQKDQRHEIGFFVGMIPNDSFFNYFPVGLRYDYFFLESVALELVGAYIPSMESGVRKDLVEFSKGAVIKVNLPERVNWYAGINAYWVPVHGKVALFSSKLTSFDIGLLIGLGVIGSEFQDTDGAYKTRWSYDGAIPFNLQANLGLGFHLFLTDYLALRLDYRHYIYPAYPGPGNSEWSDGVRSLAEITLGLGYFTPAPK
jgi:outer membrane beta-barrel protein